MSETPKFRITELAAAQSQPEIVVNEAIRILEMMSQLRVIDKDLATPPTSPTDGDAYLIPSGATGAWSAFPFYIAMAIGGDWTYVVPRVGYLAYVEDEDQYYQFVAGSPTAWVQKELGSVAGVSLSVQDEGSPTNNYSGIQTLQFTGNVVVTQINPTTVRIEILP